MSCSRTTTQWRRWGSNPRPLCLESSTLPLSHCAPYVTLLWRSLRFPLICKPSDVMSCDKIHHYPEIWTSQFENLIIYLMRKNVEVETQTVYTQIMVFNQEQAGLGLPCLVMPICLNIYNKYCEIKWATTCDFQQCGILSSVDSDEYVQPPFEFRNSKCCSVSSLTVIVFSSD